MSVYVERPSALPGAFVWTSRPSGEVTVVPDGCMDVLWFGGRLLVAGPDTTPKRGAAPGGSDDRLVGLRFAPGTGPSVLGIPAHELRDGRAWLDEVWGSRLAAAWESAFRASGGDGATLEELAGRRLEAIPPPAEIRRVASLCRRGTPVDEIARDVGWSPRTLRRRCDEAFGYGPKVLTRILRFQRAAGLVRAGLPLAEAAAASGYADQSHLSRESRAITGSPAAALRPLPVAT